MVVAAFHEGSSDEIVMSYYNNQNKMKSKKISIRTRNSL